MLSDLAYSQDRVWVYTPKTQKGLSRKLMHHWHGPFRIVEKCSPVHFKLRTCDNRLVSITVYANRMKPYYDPDSRPQAPPSIEMLDEPPIPDNELPDDALTSINGFRYFLYFSIFSAFKQ